MTRKIYFTCLHLNHGGVEMAISSLANALCKQGFDVEILCTYNFGEPVYHIDSKVKISYLTKVLPNRDKFQNALKSKNPLAIIKEGMHSLQVLYQKKSHLKRAIIQIKDGIIISTRNEDTVLLSKYGAPNVLKIAQLHHDHRFNAKLLRDFKYRYKNIDYFVLLTDNLCDEVSEIIQPYNSKTKCITIPNFIPFTVENTMVAKQKQVVSVGRLHKDKAFHRLINAWQIVHESHSDWVLKIIGDGPLKTELQAQIDSLNLSDCVILTGALDHADVMQEMAHSSIYAMSSITEAFPFVLLEAMYNYLPIVAFDVRVGPPSLIKHGQTGYLVPDNDIETFSAALCQLIDDPTLIDCFQNESHCFMQNFTEQAIIPLWMNILK